MHTETAGAQFEIIEFGTSTRYVQRQRPCRSYNSAVLRRQMNFLKLPRVFAKLEFVWEKHSATTTCFEQLRNFSAEKNQIFSELLAYEMPADNLAELI